MKQVTFFLLVCMTLSLNAQQFTKLGSSDLNNPFSDSRGVNIIDVNNDGWDDVFITNGPAAGQNNVLYLNQEGQLERQVSNPIAQDGGKSDGATFADIDNDGDLDTYVVTWYGDPNFFYTNQGDGSFELENDNLLKANGSYSETASWGDYNGDGLLDLYVTNSEGVKKNLFFENQGDGTFTSLTSLPVSSSDASRNVNWVDFDGDRDLDLYISNEGNRRNELFRNDGPDGSGWKWTKIFNNAIVMDSRATISSSWGDIDNDGDLDLFLANAGFHDPQNNQLFFNLGNGEFEAATGQAVVSDGSCSYGSGFGDYDNDGDLDLLVANGFCGSKLKNMFYENDGTGQFTKKDDALPNLTNVCSFGTAWGDLNNDGFLDLVTANCKNTEFSPQPANDFYMNNGNDNHWFKVVLEGTVTNRSAIGSNVRIKANINGQAVWQMREVTAQSGYCGQNSLTCHFGLGDGTTIDSLVVEWLSGNKTVMTDIAADQLIEIKEDNISSTIELKEILRLAISPNPFDGPIKITLSGQNHDKKLFLIINDSLGKIWYQQPLEINQMPFEMPLELNLPAGLFFFQISDGETNINKKMVKVSR